MPEFGRVVSIAEYDRPMASDDVETAQTIRYMDELAAADAGEPAVREAACDALEQAGLNFDSDPLEQAEAVYWWLQRTIRYVPTPGTSPLVDQTLISPCAVLAMPEPIGDCPQFSMLAAAIFRVIGIPSFFVTIAAEPSAPDQWSHVYNTVEVRPGMFLPFDASNGPEPGAEYARPFKRRVWPCLNGTKRKETAKAMVRAARRNAPRGGMRNRALRGALGDVTCDSDGNCYDSDTGVYTPGSSDLSLHDLQSLTTQGDCAFGTDAGGNCLPNLAPTPSVAPAPAVTPASSAVSPSGAGVLSQLISTAGAIAAPAVRAATTQTPYYVTNPQTGQSVLFNPNTGTVAGASALLGTAGSSSLLLFALLGIGVLALAGHK